MSQCDDKLLEEDMGDEEYDLGEVEEEALLAGDYEFDQNEEEPEDVLDLEAGLDDLDSEIQDGGFDHTHTSNVPLDAEHYESPVRKSVIEQFPELEASPMASEAEIVNDVVYQDTSIERTGEEEEEETEDKDEEESRVRFRSERTSTVSLKSSNQSYGHIPDTLDQVSIEGHKSSQFASRIQRGNWGRGRGGNRGSARGSGGVNFRGSANRGSSTPFNMLPSRGGHGPHTSRPPWSAGQSGNFHHGVGPRGQGPGPGHSVRPGLGRNSHLGPRHSHGPPMGRIMNPNIRPNIGPMGHLPPRGQGPPMGPNMGRNFGPGPNMRHNMSGPHNVGPPSNMGPPSNVGHPPSMGPPLNMGPPPNMAPPLNLGPPTNMGPPLSMGTPPNHGPPPNMGPLMGRSQNMSSPIHRGPNMGLNIAHNMGPLTGPPISGTVLRSMGPPVGQNLGPNLGQGMGLQISQNVGPMMGPRMGPPIGLNNSGPNMVPPMGMNMMPSVDSNLDQNPTPNFGRNVFQDIGSGMTSQFQSSHGVSNMPRSDNMHFSRVPNMQMDKPPPAQHPPLHCFSNPMPVVDQHALPPQQPSFTNFSRVIYNSSQPVDQTIIRVTEATPPRLSGQSSTKIHINPHFRGNMQGGEGRLQADANLENTLYNRSEGNNLGQTPFGTFIGRQDTQYLGNTEWPEGNVQPFPQQFTGGARAAVNEMNFNPPHLSSPTIPAMYPETSVFEDRSQCPVQQPEDWTFANQSYCPDPHQAASIADLSVSEENRFPLQQPRVPSTQATPKFSGHGARGHYLNTADRRKQTQRNHGSGMQRSPSKRSLESSPGVVPVKQVRLDSKRLKKVHNSNLHEVQTVDTLPDTTTTNETQSENETEDEETREYRKKIEEQKRTREQLLKLKEERRIQAALLKQKKEDKESVQTLNQTQTISTLVNKKNLDHLPRATNEILTEGTTVKRTTINPSAQFKIHGEIPNQPNPTQSAGRGSVVRGVGIGNRPVRGGRGAISRPSPLSSSSEVHPQTSSSSVGGRDVVQRGGRIVVMQGGRTGTRQLKFVQNMSTSYGSQLKADTSGNADLSPPGPSSSKSVTVENLSNSTNETQLRMMCNCVGRVEHLHMDQLNKKAVIKFAAPDAAAAFVKKYQRKMLDLSLIKVSIIND